MYQTVKFPLCVHFVSPSQRKAVELFVVPQIPEHRLHRGEALAILDTPFRAVDAGFHLVGVTFLSIGFAREERYLPGLGFLRCKQTAISMCTRHAVALCALKLHCRIAVDRAVAVVAVELFAGRAYVFGDKLCLKKPR